MNSDELRYWLGFSAFEGIGPLRFKLLFDYFGSVKKAWEAPEKKLLEIGLGEKLTTRFVTYRSQFPFEKILATLQAKKITVITRIDKRYPKLLSEIADPPIVLYVRGDEQLFTADAQKEVPASPAGRRPRIGVVGTRKITHYGEEVTRMIVVGLVNAGVTIVSGMAYGVDTVAHQTAIESGGKTIAVLGCGVDIIYPRENEKLYWNIVEKYGAVISEFPPGMVTARGLFPSRNRIISGLSLGTVVTEGASDSGALITAQCALEQGREVFAVPGPITSFLSAGPTKLLKQGAKLVTEAKDILEELHIKNNPISKFTNPTNKQINGKIGTLTNEELKIIELVQNENLHFDELVRKSGIAAARLGGILTMMEMNKFITHEHDGTYGLSESFN